MCVGRRSADIAFVNTAEAPVQRPEDLLSLTDTVWDTEVPGTGVKVASASTRSLPFRLSSSLPAEPTRSVTPAIPAWLIGTEIRLIRGLRFAVRAMVGAGQCGSHAQPIPPVPGGSMS